MNEAEEVGAAPLLHTSLLSQVTEEIYLQLLEKRKTNGGGLREENNELKLWHYNSCERGLSIPTLFNRM